MHAWTVRTRTPEQIDNTRVTFGPSGGTFPCQDARLHRRCCKRTKFAQDRNVQVSHVYTSRFWSLCWNSVGVSVQNHKITDSSSLQAKVNPRLRFLQSFRHPNVKSKCKSCISKSVKIELPFSLETLAWANQTSFATNTKPSRSSNAIRLKNLYSSETISIFDNNSQTLKSHIVNTGRK